VGLVPGDVLGTRRLRIESQALNPRLPACAPGLNPVECVWGKLLASVDPRLPSKTTLNTNEPEALVHPGVYKLQDGCIDTTSITGPGIGYHRDEIRRTFD